MADKVEITDSFICLSCRYFLGNYINKKPTCLAFLSGIPDEIIDGKNNHSKPLEGQLNELVYTQPEED